jgi:hypothetical protein
VPSAGEKTRVTSGHWVKVSLTSRLVIVRVVSCGYSMADGGSPEIHHG